MMMAQEAMLTIRSTKDDLSRNMDLSVYREFLDLLLAEAEGWRMELEEDADE